MSFRVGDSERARENRSWFCQHLGIEPASILLPRQVHGSKVVAISSGEQIEDAAIIQELAEADGIVSSVEGLPIAVVVADCTPVFLHDPVTNNIGIVHAGWRGTVNNIVGNAVQKMKESLGSDPKDCHAWIGPCIGQCCFGVGLDVTEAFFENLGDLGIAFGDHIDLKQINMALLIREGVQEDRIEVSDVCTYCNRAFFSHRRATHAGLSTSGRMMALISPNRP